MLRTLYSKYNLRTPSVITLLTTISSLLTYKGEYLDIGIFLPN
ncbi:MAG: hypothetical protein ACTIJ9_16825 [Aequorivita sp.]